MAQEAWRIAVRYMVPVMLLTDGYIANGSEPWRIPKFADLPKIEITHPGPPSNGDTFLPYKRDERLARPWAIPGTPGLEHRIGGLEKQDITGNVSYDPANHQHMINTRAAESGQHRQRHSAAKDRRPGERRPAGRQLGRHLRRVRDGRPQRASQRQSRCALSTCGISTRCRRTWATS